MPPSGVRVAVVGEDQAHRALVTFLADRVLLDEAAKRSAHWIDAESLDALRSYHGRGDEDHKPGHLRFYPLTQAKSDLLRRRGEACGLVAFLDALRDTLVPLFIPGPPIR